MQMCIWAASIKCRGLMRKLMKLRQRKEDILADLGTGGIDGWMDMTKIYKIFALCLLKN